MECGSADGVTMPTDSELWNERGIHLAEQLAHTRCLQDAPDHVYWRQMFHMYIMTLNNCA